MNIFDAIIGAFIALGAALSLAFSGFFGLDAPLAQTPAPLPAEEEVAIITTFPEAPAAEAKSGAGIATEDTAAKPASSGYGDSSAEESPEVASPSLGKPPSGAVSPPLAAKNHAQIDAETRAALVNIFCTVRLPGAVRSISGTGVFIDSRGVILTNAHLGQFFLLPEGSGTGTADCIVRTGSPATPAYTATVLFLPRLWVEANAAQIGISQATGTGERDFAFLLVTGPVNQFVSIPSTFPHLPLHSEVPAIGEEMVLAAYPAGFLAGDDIRRALSITSSYTAVRKVFTFSGVQQVDLFSIGGTVLSQAGSSGGAAVSVQTGALAGVIVTATNGATTAERDLHALTLGHIDRSLREESVGGIMELLLGDITARAAAWNQNTAPALTAQLRAALGVQ